MRMFSKRVFVLACLGSLNREPNTETEQSIMGHLRGLVKVEDRCCFSCTCLLKNPAEMFFVNEYRNTALVYCIYIKDGLLITEISPGHECFN